MNPKMRTFANHGGLPRATIFHNSTLNTRESTKRRTLLTVENVQILPPSYLFNFIIYIYTTKDWNGGNQGASRHGTV